MAVAVAAALATPQAAPEMVPRLLRTAVVVVLALALMAAET
jgi:hypothetical protein